MRWQKGFSLLELLITISVMAILAALALPLRSNLVLRAKSEVLNAQLLRAINLARSEAVLRDQPVTLCKSADHRSCNGAWRDGQILFVDSNQDGVVPDKNHLLFVFDSKVAGELHWRSALNRDFLRILPSSSVSAENGTFWYCAPAAKNPVWAIIISQSGRARLAYPDHKGEIEGLSC